MTKVVRMTGQEYYDRFNKELTKLTDEIDFKKMGLDLHNQYGEGGIHAYIIQVVELLDSAAKRAAGLE